MIEFYRKKLNFLGDFMKKRKKLYAALMIAALALVLAAAGVFYCSTVGRWHKITYQYGDQRIVIEDALTGEVCQAFRDALKNADRTWFHSPEEEPVFGGLFFMADLKPVTYRENCVQIGAAYYQLTEEGKEQLSQTMETLREYCQVQIDQ